MSTKFLIAFIITSTLVFNQSVLAKPAIAARFIRGSSALVKKSNNIKSFKYTENGKTFSGLAYCSQAEPAYSVYSNGDWETIIPTSSSGIALFQAACK